MGLSLLSVAAHCLFLGPSSSAPVEPVFSQGGLGVQQAGVDLLHLLVFLSCNALCGVVPNKLQKMQFLQNLMNVKLSIFIVSKAIYEEALKYFDS